MKLPKEEGGLGFRDLYTHLILQCLHDKGGECYIPLSRFVHDCCVQNISWMEILFQRNRMWEWAMFGKAFLKDSMFRENGLYGELVMGLVWKFGRIHGSPRSPSSHKGECELVKVSELINETFMSWNRQLIEQHFLPVGLSVIMNIPLRANSEDFVAWHFDQRGIFQ
jgi:hypothetical protein